MKWIIPGPNVKIIAQGIHCLAKLGENLYIEGLPSKLAFRTVNLSKTAFASFNFTPEFFSFYPDVSEKDPPRCEISMKAALIVFRFPSAMEKSVESCAVILTPKDNIVEFRIKFKHGFVKKNKLHLIECETLQASYEEEQLPSRVVYQPKVLTSILSSFQTHEITWAVSNSGVQLRNFSEYYDDGSGLRSEVYLSKEDAIEMVVTEEAELTFCLQELKTILTFSEQIGCPLTMSFSESGKPIFFIVRTDILVAHIVLATLGLSSSQSTNATSISEQEVRPKKKQRRLDKGVIPSSDASIDNDLMEIEDPMDEFGNGEVDQMDELDYVPIDNVQDEVDRQSTGEQSLNSTLRRREIVRRVFRRREFIKPPGFDDILAPDSDEEVAY